jgi:streptogramin lyase
MAELASGTLFAGHRIEGVAGRGGMGVVYHATHLALERTVALKVIAPALVDDSAARQRFLRESKLAASLDHPNVIPVYYTGEEDGVAYIAMRYVQGWDLRSLVREEGRLAPARAAQIIAQVGAALDAAHAAGLIHRDVKPGNILLTADDHVYLSDFGLSKHALSLDGATRSGHWVGTLDYVAPEQIRGDRVDARADVYALGCVLAFALTGVPPFQREGDEAKLWAHLTERPPAPSDRVPGLPPALDSAVARALAKRPDDRYPSAGDLGRAAVAAAEHRSVRQPERTVGVGAAAADETPTESGGGATTTPQPESDAPAATEPRTNPRRWARAALGGAAAAVTALTALMLALGASDNHAPARRRAERPAATSTATPARPAVTTTVRVGGRPNGIAVGNGLVFVTRFASKRVTLIDAKTAKLRRPRPTVGVGALDVTMGLGAIWVAGYRDHAIYKLDPATGRKLARFTLPQAPRAVAAGPKGLWIGLLSAAPGTPDTLARLDPRTGRIILSVPVPEGTGPLVVTPNGVWVGHRLTPSLARFNVSEGRFDVRKGFGHSRLGKLAFGAGAVFVTSPQEDTVARIDDRTGQKLSSGVGRRPEGIGARGRHVWVTSYIDHTIWRVDAATSLPTGQPVPVPLNPYRLAVTSDGIWVASVGRGVIARIR